MNRSTQAGPHVSQHLSFQNMLPNFDHRLCNIADMLFQSDEQMAGYASEFERLRNGNFLPMTQLESTMKVPDPSAYDSFHTGLDLLTVCCESLCGWGHFHESMLTTGGTISMQSTGHGGRHNSQPVHSAAITVCIFFAAPKIASTGQA